jgi:O-succinylbenzoate synthase
VRLDAVELFVVRLPLVRPFETSFGRLEQREFVLVKVNAAGLAGWGECVAEADPFYSAETTTTAWHILTKYLVPAALAEPISQPGDVQDRWAVVRGHPMAKAALEMAVWDLMARLEDRPLFEMLGGTDRPIAAGVSIGIQASVSALVERVHAELAEGYQRVKIKIKPGWDIEPVDAVRRALPDLTLMVDANAAYRPDDESALMALDAFGLDMIEQPLDYDDLVRHARLQRRVRTAICLDESIAGPASAEDALELGACRIINIKPGRMGGHGPSKQVHDLARERHVPDWHGGMLESGIGRAHNLHLSSLPGFTLPGDVAGSRRYFVPDLIDHEIEVRRDGTILVPSGAGIGVEPAPDRLRAATIHTERLTA